jgi:uncharacterized protein YidB (DUF937 family)
MLCVAGPAIKKEGAMGLFDSVVQGLTGGQGGGAPLQQALTQLLEQGGTEGLTGLAKNFHSQGLGDIFSSWVGTGENKPISSDQLQNVLGEEKLQQLSSGAGMPLQAALPLLTQLLPVLIDKLSPQGQLPANNNLLQQGLSMLLGRK